jgi:hypothetical protein
LPSRRSPDSRSHLAAGHDEALDVSSLDYIAPMARRSWLRYVRSTGCSRSGNGVPVADYGDDLHEAQAAFTRPLFENLLGKESLPAVPEIHERLLTDPPAPIADFACGQGRSSIEIARAYAKVRVDGNRLGPRLDRARARESTSSAAGSRTG